MRYNVFRKYANDGLILLARQGIRAALDARCFAPCCASRNARGAIFLGSLTSKLAVSLCVDYLAHATTPRLGMTVAVAVAIEEASK